MAHFICEQCEKGFKRAKAGLRPIRFCSQNCYRLWKKENNITGGQFKKGSIPWNKDKKGIHLSRKTEFKKGHKFSIKYPVGTVRIRHTKRDNKERAYIKIQEPNKWILRCYFVWIKKYGAIPKGLLIHHIDKNTLNDNISNLALINRSTHMNKHRQDLLKNRK